MFINKNQIIPNTEANHSFSNRDFKLLDSALDTFDGIDYILLQKKTEPK